ncbi:MAG: hypothetical protein F6K47_38880, partial [Symploca sp. SIO2E6]|nr:hypothetical protein [Symploca sp. SIO2E6]
MRIIFSTLYILHSTFYILHSLFTHHSLLITHYSLLITHYSLLITHYSFMLSESQKLFRGVGTEIKPGMEIEEILERGKLNWKVEVQEFQYDTPLGLKNSKDYSTFVAYRSDTGDLLTTIGQGWKPFQNYDLVKNFLEFCDRSNLQPDWIGFLPRKRGARSHVAPNMLFIS